MSVNAFQLNQIGSSGGTRNYYTNVTNVNNTYINQSLGSYNVSYDSWLGNYTLNNKWWSNQSLPFYNWLGTFNYNYNQTYSGSTYNITYNLWSYNQTYSGSTYNVTYNAKVSAVNDGITLNSANITNVPATWLSTFNSTYNLWSYNQTYSGSTYNVTYNAKVSAVNDGITLNLANLTTGIATGNFNFTNQLASGNLTMLNKGNPVSTTPCLIGSMTWNDSNIFICNSTRRFKKASLITI